MSGAELTQVLAASYRGTDLGRLVTAIVDGEGRIQEVTFAKTVARHDHVVVEEAVRAAIAAAQQSAGDAITALATRTSWGDTP